MGLGLGLATSHIMSNHVQFKEPNLISVERPLFSRSNLDCKVNILLALGYDGRCVIHAETA